MGSSGYHSHRTGTLKRACFGVHTITASGKVFTVPFARGMFARAGCLHGQELFLHEQEELGGCTVIRDLCRVLQAGQNPEGMSLRPEFFARGRAPEMLAPDP
jgi:hypothetical protein